MIIVVAARSLVVASEEAVLDFPKKIFSPTVEKRQGDAVLLGAGAVRKAHGRIIRVIVRAIVVVLGLEIGSLGQRAAHQGAGVPIIIFGVLHQVGRRPGQARSGGL